MSQRFESIDCLSQCSKSVHKTLKSATSKRQICGNASNMKADYKGRGSEKCPYDESPELHSICHKCYVSPTASEALSYGQNFLGGACHQTPLERCLPHQPPLYMYACPSSISGSATCCIARILSFLSYIQHKSSYPPPSVCITVPWLLLVS